MLPEVQHRSEDEGSFALAPKARSKRHSRNSHRRDRSSEQGQEQEVETVPLKPAPTNTKPPVSSLRRNPKLCFKTDPSSSVPFYASPPTRKSPYPQSRWVWRRVLSHPKTRVSKCGYQNPRDQQIVLIPSLPLPVKRIFSFCLSSSQKGRGGIWTSGWLLAQTPLKAGVPLSAQHLEDSGATVHKWQPRSKSATAWRRR